MRTPSLVLSTGWEEFPVIPGIVVIIKKGPGRPRVSPGPWLGTFLLRSPEAPGWSREPVNDLHFCWWNSNLAPGFTDVQPSSDSAMEWHVVSNSFRRRLLTLPNSSSLYSSPKNRVAVHQKSLRIETHRIRTFFIQTELFQHRVLRSLEPQRHQSSVLIFSASPRA